LDACPFASAFGFGFQPAVTMEFDAILRGIAIEHAGFVSKF
jgi:hypothetical protein